MTLDQLARHLAELAEHGLSGDAVVRVWCPDRGCMVPAGSLVYSDNQLDIGPEEPPEDYEDD